MTDTLDRTRYPVDPWRLIETAPPVDATHSESVFALGNGFVGRRGGRDEGEPAPSCFVNGFYETWPIKYPEDAFGLARVGQTIQPAPSPTLEVTVDGHRLGVGQPLSERQELDMRTGVLTRETTWGTPAGPVTVRAQRLVSFTRRGLVASVIEVTPGQPADIAVTPLLELPVVAASRKGLDPRTGTVLSDPVYEMTGRQTTDDQLSLGVRTAHAGRELTCVVKAQSSVDQAAELTSLAWYEMGDYNTAVKVASQQLADAQALGWAGLVAEQTAWLDNFWAVADVEVDDPALQQAIRWSIFQTIQAAARADGQGVAAKGVTGSGYDGHYFWDMETYVLPFLTYTQPEAARSALGYRLATLPQAQIWARELSLKGALFPWRTIDGREASAYFPAGTAAYHIDADIAHAFAQYVTTTGDESILQDGGAELVIETARMWASRGFWGDDGLFHLHYVTGPDEYSAMVDDNVYTNVMARANLRFAADVAVWVERLPDASVDEIAEWRRIADGMCVPFDEARGVHAQDAAFLRRERWDLASIPRENFPLLLHYHPLTIYRHQVLKQADVVLAQIVCPGDFTEAEKLANFDFYDPLTTGDSTLSAVPQAIAAAEVGHLELALDYLERAAFVDLANSHGNTDAGVHVAVTAGVWNALVSGFGGLRDASWGNHPVGGLVLNPQLPPGWTRLKFSLLYHGVRLGVEVTPDGVTLTADGAIELTVWGRPVRVEDGRMLRLDATFTAVTESVGAND